jgi:hypothetical protein|tara:strand:- start:618 stop:905 length:288 start_codon:yes stop_codon:yes gene_type:complete
MRAALLLVLILNILDAALTSFVISNAMAVEANPIMGAILEYGIVPFVVVKLGVISLSLRVLWVFKDRKLAQIGTAVCIVCYSCLILYFIYNFLSI